MRLRHIAFARTVGATKIGSSPSTLHRSKRLWGLCPMCTTTTCKEDTSLPTPAQGESKHKSSGGAGSEDPSTPVGGSTFFLTLFGIWSATLSCLSNAAVSLEGDLEPQRIDIDRILRRHEKSSHPPQSSGILRYDYSHIASNEPPEDEHKEAVLPVPSGHWSLFGIFDGHNGGATSRWLADNLLPAAAGALADLYSSVARTGSGSTPEPAPSDIHRVLMDTFTRLDDDIVNGPVQTALSSPTRQAGLELLAPAYAGSCALLAFYDSHSRRVHVAITGDSRAILGRPTYSDAGELRYDVYILTTEQNGANPDELARIKAAHPGEDVVQNGRVFGVAVSRAFGDARYKWSRDVQEKLRRRNLGRAPLSEVKTPPYITAEPDVTSIEIEPGDFLIMATDGVWESLTSEEAVGLVGLWKEGQRHGFTKREPVGGYAPHTLPVCMAERDDTVRYRQWNAEKRFVRSDANAATHLLRNAIGGADKELASSLLSMRQPKARMYRDDMTALVVFFSEEGRTAQSERKP